MLKNVRILERLKIWQKLILVALFMGLPIPILTSLYVAEKNHTIEFAQKEIYGTEYLPLLTTLAKDLARHRGLANAYLRGETSFQAQLAETERVVEQELSLAEELDQKEVSQNGQSYGALLQATGRLHSIRLKWDVLKGKTLGVSAQNSFEEHTQLINTVNDLILHVGDQSNLILDPDLDSYYLMNASVVQLPSLLEQVGRLRGLSAGLAAAQKITPAEHAEITALFGQFQANLKSVERGINIAYNVTPVLRERHAGQAEVALRECEDFANWVLREVLTAEKPPTAAQVMAAGTQQVERVMRFDQVVINDLQALLTIRIERVVRERNLVLLVTSLAFLLTVFAVFVITRRLNQQTRELNQLIVRIDQGNYNERAKVFSQDELGQIAKAFNLMLDNTKGLMQSRAERDEIQRSIMKLLEEVSGVAEGDLTREAEVTEGMTGAIADAFNYMTDNLRQLIGRVQRVTTQVNTTASETQTTAERLAQGSQEQAAQITNTSTTLNEMARTIQNVAESAEISARVADQSVVSARKGSEVVQDTMYGMQRILEQVQETARRIQQLNERSQEIEEIIHLIDEIADRTGVLALNASIQATTAGEAGQGFVIVANEVEKLAGRSAEATKRISTLIRTIQGGTREALNAMETTSREVQGGAKLAVQAGESLQEIEAISDQLADLVRAIAEDCKQQAHSTTQLSKTMTKIANITNQTTTGVIQSAVTVKSLAQLADELHSSLVTFKLPQEAAPGTTNGLHKPTYQGTAHLN